MFNLPSDISYRQEQLPNAVAFVFRHSELGDLGRILLQERSDGPTQILCEVVGDPNDPMTAKRGAIFEPIGRELANQLDEALEGSAEPASSRDPHSPKQPPNSIEKLPVNSFPA